MDVYKLTNLVQKAIAFGGKLSPLVISDELTSGTGLMNPSVFVNSKNEIFVNLRHVNYTLYHSENQQRFISLWGPMAYLHPESDQALRTTNYICKLDEDLLMIGYGVVDTSEFDVTPLWEFTGEEDCRLVEWDGKYYNIGVRRDTTPHGEGRMELSEITIDEDTWTVKEVSRMRIPAPGDNNSYCEKNWMPILDKPFHFVKWTSPTEVVRTWPDEPARCEQVSLTPGLTPPKDQRGGSQVIRWGDFYIAITHEVHLFKNYLNQKDGIYRHRLVVWDEQFNLIGLSPEPLTFLEGRVEFVAGAAKYGDDLLVSFGFQDNASYVLQVPKVVVEELISNALLVSRVRE
jgi:hypothetical protein